MLYIYIHLLFIIVYMSDTTSGVKSQTVRYDTSFHFPIWYFRHPPIVDSTRVDGGHFALPSGLVETCWRNYTHHFIMKYNAAFKRLYLYVFFFFVQKVVYSPVCTSMRYNLCVFIFKRPRPTLSLLRMTSFSATNTFFFIVCAHSLATDAYVNDVSFVLSVGYIFRALVILWRVILSTNGFNYIYLET